jgi:hypothetical protein
MPKISSNSNAGLAKLLFINHRGAVRFPFFGSISLVESENPHRAGSMGALLGWMA